MSAVAVAVGAFAVGMAGLLNHFKYRATATRIIEQRLNETGKSIESSILSSLPPGLQFADRVTLPAMLQQVPDAELVAGLPAVGRLVVDGEVLVQVLVDNAILTHRSFERALRQRRQFQRVRRADADLVRKPLQGLRRHPGRRQLAQQDLFNYGELITDATAES